MSEFGGPSPTWRIHLDTFLADIPASLPEDRLPQVGASALDRTMAVTADASSPEDAPLLEFIRADDLTTRISLPSATGAVLRR